MLRWYERANEASFKPTSGGYVFQAPSPWIFARPRYYLVDETQKAQLLVGLGRWRAHLVVASLINAAVTLAVILPATLWPATFVRPILPLFLHLGIGLFTLLLCALMMLVMAPLFVVPQIHLARTLRSVLAEALITEERIRLSEQLRKIATSASAKVLAVGLIGALGMMAGGTLQMLDAFMDGHFASRALPHAVILSMGALLTAYFLYLIRLRVSQRRS